MKTQSYRSMFYLVVTAAALVWGVGLAQIPGPNVNVVSGIMDQFKGDLFLQRQNEPTIAVSSRNPDHLLAAANDYRTVDFAGDPNIKPAAEAWHGVYRSYDRGRTWTGSLLPGYPQDNSPAGLKSPLRGLTAGADPVLASGTGGLLYLGGIAFIRGGLSKIFVARYSDRNDVEGGETIAYDFTTVVDQGSHSATGLFVDKPSLIADHSRTPGSDPAACGNVYISYSRFEGLEADGRFRTSIYVAVSNDCGLTFSRPIKVSNPYIRGQGTALGIDPNSGAVYVVWREFADKNSLSRMLMAKSTDGGKRFSSPVSIIGSSAIQGYDQATISPQDGPATARTNGYPTMAIDGKGRLYAAWQERVGASGYPLSGGNPRIVLTSSEGGASWTTWTQRRAVEYGPTGESVPALSYDQFMPALSFGGGVLRLLFYDFRNDPVRGLNPTTGFLSGIDRRADVRVAQANFDDLGNPLPLDGDKNPVFSLSEQVSQYLTQAGTDPPQVITTAPNYPALNRPNLPMYQGGRTPFFGDYIALVPGVQFVRTDAAAGVQSGQTAAAAGTEFPWRWATRAMDTFAQTSHAIWTDHRDVIPPADADGDPSINGNWTAYAPPGTGAASCINPGSRNANIYTSEISNGVVAGSPQTFIQLLPSIESTFVVYVINRMGGSESRLFRLTLVSTDPNLKLSWVQTADPFERQSVVDVEILPHSTVTYPVFALCQTCDPKASFSVKVEEVIKQSDGSRIVKPGGLKTSVTFNADPTNPQVSSGGIRSPQISSPKVSSPQVSSPQISSPQVSSPQVSSPQISSPQISSPQISSGTPQEVTDYTWTMKNTGDAEAPYTALTNIQNATDLQKAGYQFQLIIYRTSAIPTAPIGQPCPTVELQLDDVISNIVDPQAFATPQVSNPQISNPQVSNPQVSSPQISSPQVSNATFSVSPLSSAPGGNGHDGTTHAPRKADRVKVTLRVFKFAPKGPNLVSAAMSDTTGGLSVGSSAFDIKRVSQSVVGQVAEPDGTYAFDATLAITTESLSSGTVGVEYSAPLAAIGGETPYTWNVSLGSLPPGLNINKVSGLISGCPIQAGTFNFTIEVKDSTPAPGQQTYLKDFSITINKAATKTTVTSSQKASYFGEDVTFTAQVSVMNQCPAPLPTGDVTFKDGNSILDIVALNSGSGQATFSTFDLSVGPHSITAEYNGDSNYLTSFAGLSQQVEPAPTTTAVASSLPLGSYFGEDVTFTATVTALTHTSAQNKKTPTGTVTFSEGDIALSPPVALDSAGKATFSTFNLQVGTHSIKATYSPSPANFLASFSAVEQKVDPAPTTTAVSSSSPLHTSVFGEPVTFTATVRALTHTAANNKKTPTGAVTFKDGGTVLGPAMLLDSSGQATFATSSLSVGPHSITAVYAHTGNFLGSTSAALSQVVNKANTTTAITGDTPDPSVVGQPVTVNFSVTVNPPGSGTPTGTVTVSDGAATCSGALTAGSSSCVLTPTSPGTNPLTATYSGDANFNGSSDTEPHQSVAAAQVCVAPPSGLVSWWPGDGNASDVQDGNGGTLVGGVTFAPGMVGQAFNLPGSSRIEVADAANLRITGPITLDAWVSFAGLSPQTLSNSPIVAKWGDTTKGTAGYGLFVYANGRPSIAVSPDGSNKFEVVSPDSLPPGTLAHVAGVWTGTALQLYVNGVLKATTAFTGSIFNNAGTPLLIGGYDPARSNGSDSMTGVIDEVEIYNRALSLSEIQAIFNAGSAGKCKRATGVLTYNSSTNIAGAWTQNLSQLFEITADLNKQKTSLSIDGSPVLAQQEVPFVQSATNLARVAMEMGTTGTQILAWDDIRVHNDANTITIFNADFNGDIVDAPPDTTLPGVPQGDSLTISNQNGSVLVRASSGNLSNKPVELKQFGGTNDVALSGTVAGTPPTHGVWVVRWRSLVRSPGTATPIFTAIVLRDSSGRILASLEYR